MKYAILMTSPPGVWEGLSEARQAEVVAAHDAFSAELRSAGRYVCSYRLGEADEARTVWRDADGAITELPGPVDPKVGALGGLYVIEADSMQEALDWGRRSRFIEGANEVRPIWE